MFKVSTPSTGEQTHKRIDVHATVELLCQSRVDQVLSTHDETLTVRFITCAVAISLLALMCTCIYVSLFDNFVKPYYQTLFMTFGA